MSEPWYYNLNTGKAEQGKQSHSEDRLGPYIDEATALKALEIARERNRAADRADEEWSS